MEYHRSRALPEMSRRVLLINIKRLKWSKRDDP